MLKERESNLEALRIVSMMMVVLVHIDGASLGLPSPKGDLQALTSRDVWRLAVESITIIGVNCFTLISGYFGIRLRLKSVAGFLFQCLFYSVVIASLAPPLLGIDFSWIKWFESWLVLSHTDLWYVPAYFCLMLLSPMLNAGVEMLTRKQFAWVLGIFIVFNIWSGWWWRGAFNPTGYTVIQLILMYLIGRWINISDRNDRNVRIGAVSVYLLSAVLIFVSSLCLEPEKAFAYNSPFVILASVSFFKLFLTFRFQSRAVNYMARSAFAVYLIHKAPELWGNLMRPQVYNLWRGLSLYMFSLTAIALTFTIYIIAMIIDPFRRFLQNKIIKAGCSIASK